MYQWKYVLVNEFLASIMCSFAIYLYFLGDADSVKSNLRFDYPVSKHTRKYVQCCPGGAEGKTKIGRFGKTTNR